MEEGRKKKKNDCYNFLNYITDRNVFAGAQ